MKEAGEFSRLLDKYFEGSCSRAELEELFAWIRRMQDDEHLQDRLQQEWERTAAGDARSMHAVNAARPDWDRMFSRITGAVSDEPFEKPVRRLTTAWKWTAAVLLVLSLMGAGYLIYGPFAPQPPLHVTRTPSIIPGDNKAMLTLSDGTRIVLDSADEGLLARQRSTIVNKDRDGRLVYHSGAAGQAEGPPLMNTVSTPRGGQYQITLPDGTAVWLNAASSLQFPASFTGSERRVELSGEAYFEVAPDKTKPFLVSSRGQTVEVLGTHFNITAYEDEPTIKTTLLEGTVKVTEKGAGKSQLLHPGQEAILAASGEITLAAAVPGQATAWKNGKFMFNGESIEHIMRRIARWYDAEIIYRGNLENTYFTGSVSRFSAVTDVLRKLELTGTVHFKIEGRRITVMP